MEFRDLMKDEDEVVRTVVFKEYEETVEARRMEMKQRREQKKAKKEGNKRKAGGHAMDEESARGGCDRGGIERTTLRGMVRRVDG